MACGNHDHWSHGFEIGQAVEVNGEIFKVIGISTSNISLEIIEQ